MRIKQLSLAIMALGMATAAHAAADDSATDKKVEKITVTGSSIKRVAKEGALPVTVVTREQLESSGATTVSEYMRSSTFSSAGNFRPQSGSTGQATATMDLRGLGANRTLVLLDGRRLPKSPILGDSADLNTVPMAAVERIEILTDGASAIYGSDAIGGVVNIITRKNYEGAQFVYGESDPNVVGGDRDEGSFLMGLNSDKGRMIAGGSFASRGIVFTKDRPWGQTKGVSTYGNNYVSATGIKAIPGGCEAANTATNPAPYFWTTASGTCSFDFNKVAADEAEIKQKSMFARGEYSITDGWQAIAQASASNVRSFGRYAPSLAAFSLPGTSPYNPRGDGKATTVYHRFAALGPRNTNTDGTQYDYLGAVSGNITDGISIEAGVRHTASKYHEFGRNYVVIPIAQQYIASGLYSLTNPAGADPDVLSAMKATVTREGIFRQNELYASATAELMQLSGGALAVAGRVEKRTEDYADIFDSLSEAGVIGGSAGNSASGSRDVSAIAMEVNAPILSSLELSLAGRYEKYSDYGNDFSPKASFRWSPAKEFMVRGSIGRGFRAPDLKTLNQKTTYSAESVYDPVTCKYFGNAAAGCDALTTAVQVDTYYKANPQLKSEKSKQWSVGATWDATKWASIKLDYWSIELDDTIGEVTPQSLIDRSNKTDPRAIPAGLGVFRNAFGSIERIDAGYANEGVLETSGADLDLLVNYKFDSLGRFRHNLKYSRVMEYKDDGEELVNTVGLPKFRAQLENTFSRGNIDFAWNINVIGSQLNSGAARYVPTYVTHDLQVGWESPWKGTLNVGVVNAGDKQPKLVSYDGRNFNFYLYDAYGRTPYVRYTQKF